MRVLANTVDVCLSRFINEKLNYTFKCMVKFYFLVKTECGDFNTKHNVMPTAGKTATGIKLIQGIKIILFFKEQFQLNLI
jgi:hypothetical protein